MKKTFLTIVLVSFVIFSYGEKSFDLGVKAGVNMSKFSSNYGTTDLKSDLKGGYILGAFMRIGGNLYLQPELLWVQKMTSSVVKTNTSTTTTEITYKSFQVPILVGLKVLDLKFLSLRINTGPAISFTADTEPSANVLLNKTMWDWKLGAGVDFGAITIDVRYDLGLSNLSANSAIEKLKGNSFTASVGIKIF